MFVPDWSIPLESFLRHVTYINLCKSNVIIDQEFINPKNEKYLFFLQRFCIANVYKDVTINQLNLLVITIPMN